MWAGIAGNVVEGGYEVAISVHDSVYNTDFQSSTIPSAKGQSIDPDAIEEHVLRSLGALSSEHVCKFVGAGVTLTLLKEVRAFHSDMRARLLRYRFLPIMFWFPH